MSDIPPKVITDNDLLGAVTTVQASQKARDAAMVSFKLAQTAAFQAEKDLDVARQALNDLLA